jgi:hypothetical protein
MTQPPRNKWAGAVWVTVTCWMQRSGQVFKCSSLRIKTCGINKNLTGRKIAILELWTNHRPTLEEHFDYIRIAVEGLSSGAYLVLEKP